MGRTKVDKGKEFRPRLHDGMDKLSQIGRFVIIKVDSEEAAETLSKQAIYVRPNRAKGPVRIA
jgi:hypothetical protein